MPRKRTEAEFWEFFWTTVDRRAPSECWPWRGGSTRGGYGAVLCPAEWTVKDSAENAARLAWAFVNQAVPLGKAFGVCIRHDCDNPPCCNPAHLRIGTDLQNALDARSRGRNYHHPIRKAGRDALYRGFDARFGEYFGMALQPLCDRALPPRERLLGARREGDLLASRLAPGHEERVSRLARRVSQIGADGASGRLSDRIEKAFAGCTLWNDVSPAERPSQRLKALRTKMQDGVPVPSIPHWWKPMFRSPEANRYYLRPHPLLLAAVAELVA